MGNDRIIYFSIERVIMRGYVRDTKEVDKHIEDDGD